MPNQSARPLSASRSALDHADAVAHYITRGSPFLPHSIGRTAIAHGLRAMHYLDDQADELERAARRINEWLYALEESARRRKGIVAAGQPGADTMQDEQPILDRMVSRAEALGLPVTKGGQPWHVGDECRWSTMKLAERYLSGTGGGGVASMVMRSHAAMDHGVETALLGTVADQLGPHGVNVFQPSPMEVPRLAFILMGVPLTSISAIRALHHHYGWPSDDRAAREAAKEQALTIEIWQRAIAEYPDEDAPERPRTGIFGERRFGQPRPM
jgi:hypothetical protein